LVANLATVAAEIVRVKPASAKGRYVQKLTVSSTMGPGVRVDVGKIEDLAGLAH
jgi:large subunit ribosomal protein L1